MLILGADEPDLNARRIAQRNTTTPNDTDHAVDDEPDERICFGAAFDANPRHAQQAYHSDDDNSNSISIGSSSTSDDSSMQDEDNLEDQYSIDSQSSVPVFYDSPNFDSLTLSSPKGMNGGNAHKENMKKTTPKKAVKSPVVGKKESSLPDNIRLNRDLSDID